MTYTYFIKKAGKSFDVDYGSFSAEVRESIIKAGLGRILNDLVAGTEKGKPSVDAVNKKLEAWARGEVRTSSERASDPIAKRAMELASSRISKNPTYIKWMQDNGLKLSSKESIAKLRELAKAAIAKEGNPFTAQAKIDVEAEEALAGFDLDIEIEEEEEGE